MPYKFTGHVKSVGKLTHQYIMSTFGTHALWCIFQKTYMSNQKQHRTGTNTNLHAGDLTALKLLAYNVQYLILFTTSYETNITIIPEFN